jgi:hypothetical protein
LVASSLITVLASMVLLTGEDHQGLATALYAQVGACCSVSLTVAGWSQAVHMAFSEP